MPGPIVKVYGIRHHGPGSALRLREALIELQPDVILVEGPVDAEATLRKLSVRQVDPPVALTALDKNSKTLQAYYPFAHYSPEWIAILFAAEHEVPIHFIDLPFTEKDERERVERDPLKALAKESGYTDVEKWWEVLFEHQATAEDVFDIISGLIENVRSEGPSRREIFMCQQINAHMSSDYTRAAVVCGAWHAPVLSKFETLAPDTPLNIQSSLKYYWIPWSNEQLSIASGYSAGVRAPQYYECLYDHPEQAIEVWLARAGELIRKYEFHVSPAQLIDTANLAFHLAAIRHREVPGIDELWDALVTIFPDNKSSVLRSIQQKIFVGERKGLVSPEINELPLVNDFYDQIRHFRLRSMIDTQKSNDRQLDLRKPFHLEMSRFFYQCLILGLEWPVQASTEVEHEGHHFQYWNLSWSEVIDQRLIESSHHGITVVSASRRKLTQLVEQIDSLENIWKYLEWGIFGNISEVLPLVLQKGQELAGESDNGHLILHSWLEIKRIRDFVHILEFDTDVLDRIASILLPKVYLTIPLAYHKMDEDTCGLFARNLLKFDSYQSADISAWLHALRNILNDNKAPELLDGLVTRLLLGYGEFEEDGGLNRIKFQFSGKQEIEETATWLQGFLMSGKLDFITDSGILEIIDAWVQSLEPDAFKDIIFGLRKSFNAFTPEEKVNVLQLIDGQKKAGGIKTHHDSWVTSEFLEMFKPLFVHDEGEGE